ncbi:MAG: diguanylate cyclase [Planctomycetes bacterium]|nr:diguanylate cyclase [Planctomycetota bacterium]
MPKLVVLTRPGAQVQEFPLGKRSLTMGREPENEVQLEGLEVSRKHCRVEPLPKGPGYRIIDLNSKNGTFLNGLQITAMALDIEDQVRVGDSLVVYVDDDADAEEVIAGIDQGTSWLPVGSESSTSGDLLEEETSDEDLSTWRASGSRPGAGGPHTRSSNRSYLKERLLRLGMLSQNIASAPDLSRLMDTILDEVLDFTGFERGLLLLGEEDGRGARLQPVRGRCMDHEHLDDHARRFSRGLVEEALRDRAITIRTGLAATDNSFSLRESVVSMGLESALCIPLLTPRRLSARAGRDDRRHRSRASRVLGAIYLDSTSDIRALDKPDLRLLEAVAAQAAIALQNARLHHQATTDPLTGLHNRGFLRQVFDDELRNAEEEGDQLTVLMLDLDHFKKINDGHGHDVGDEVLRRVSARLKRALRVDDYACRWGGEEFLVLLPGTNGRGARIVADKVAVAIRSQPIGEAGLTVTASIGLSIYPEHGTSSELLIKRADQALYAAKTAGRNRVTVFTEDLDHTGHRQDPFEGLFDGNSAHAQRNLKAIFDTIDLLRSTRPPLEILRRTLDHVVDLTRARRALLIVAAEGLKVTAARAAGGRTLLRGLREYSHSTVETAIQERRSFCNLTADEEGFLDNSSVDRLGLNTVMCVPIFVSGKEVFGVLYADDTIANREFGPRDLSHLEMIAHQLGLGLASSVTLYRAAQGETLDEEGAGEDETSRLRSEVLRLRLELEQTRTNTRKFRRSRIPPPRID